MVSFRRRRRSRSRRRRRLLRVVDKVVFRRGGPLRRRRRRIKVVFPHYDVSVSRRPKNDGCFATKTPRHVSSSKTSSSSRKRLRREHHHRVVSFAKEEEDKKRVVFILIGEKNGAKFPSFFSLHFKALSLCLSFDTDHTPPVYY